MTLDAQQTSADGLTTETWSFRALDTGGRVDLVLSRFERVVRTTKRRKGAVVAVYVAGQPNLSTIPESAVPASRTIADATLAKYVASVRVVAWGEGF